MQHVAPLGTVPVLPASEVQGFHLQTQVAALCKEYPDCLASAVREAEAPLLSPRNQSFRDCLIVFIAGLVLHLQMSRYCSVKLVL